MTTSLAANVAPPRFKPNVTVAAIVEHEGKFLIVEEDTSEGIGYNQPAGHLEEGESLLAAVVRETLEETRYDIEPTALVGLYQWKRPQSATTYLRVAFACRVLGHDPARTLDAGICAARWLTRDELVALAKQHRSPYVLRCLDDYLAGKRYPLDLIAHYH